MDAPTLFDPIPWRAVGISALQTFLIYWFAILGHASKLAQRG